MAGYTVSSTDGAALPPDSYSAFYEENAPRAVAVINGKNYAIKSYEVSKNAHGATDAATVQIPISNGTDLSVDLFRGQGGSGTADFSSVIIEIYAGYPDSPSPSDISINQLHRRFLGVVDNYNATFQEDSVTFTCRSMAAPLVDGKVTKVSVGQSVVSFAAEQCLANGLTFVPTLPAGYQPVTIQEILGREFVGGSNFNATLYNKKPWDLIIQGAQFDGADVWVDDDKLNYAVQSLVQRTKIQLQYGRDLTGLQAEHAIQYNKNVKVIVRTYQKKVRTSTSLTIKSNGKGGYTEKLSSKVATSTPIFGTPDNLSTTTSSDGSTSVSIGSTTGGSGSASTSEGTESANDVFTFYIPNLAPGRVAAIARAKWLDISMRQFRTTITLPMTKGLLPQLSITSKIGLLGVPYTLFNRGDFLIRRFNETFSAEAAWTLSLETISGPIPAGEV